MFIKNYDGGLMQSRKNLYSTMLSIGSLKNKYEYVAHDIKRTTSHDEYEQTIKHYDKVIANLTKELMSMPIGYRYTGTFYIKNSYTIPTTFTKHDGVVFMREDLVSWQIEEGLDRPDSAYHRNIYKEPREGAELKKEDAEAVYEKRSATVD